MEATPARGSGSAALDCYSNQGTVKVFSKTIVVETVERTDLVNLTENVRALVEASGVRDGFVQVSSLHTTAAVFVNEWQDALLTDIRTLIERVVPRELYYRHNDPEHSDCDRQNADAHLRNVLMGLSVTVPVSQGAPVLGRWQSVILAEFDGPNQRNVFFQVFGI